MTTIELLIIAVLCHILARVETLESKNAGTMWDQTEHEANATVFHWLSAIAFGAAVWVGVSTWI